MFGSKVIGELLAESQVSITSWVGLASVGRRVSQSSAARLAGLIVPLSLSFFIC